MKLDIQKVNKSYGKRKVLINFSAVLENGIYGLLGPNGAGKTTLMNILVNDISMESGNIILDGRDIFQNWEWFSEKLGYVPQQQAYYGQFSIYEYLNYICILKGIEKYLIKEEIEKAIKEVNLTKEIKTKMSKLSGGMRQRVMIAQALLGQPQIIIMDEPTAGLDPRERIRIRNLIAKISKDKMILMATHVVSDVEFIANKILLLKKGELLLSGSPQEIQSGIMGKVYEVRVIEEQIQDLYTHCNVCSLYRDEEHILARIIAEEPPKQMENRKVMPDLEDVYLYYFGEEA